MHQAGLESLQLLSENLSCRFPQAHTKFLHAPGVELDHHFVHVFGREDSAIADRVCRGYCSDFISDFS